MFTLTYLTSRRNEICARAGIVPKWTSINFPSKEALLAFIAHCGPYGLAAYTIETPR